MDLNRIIGELLQERERVDKAIAALEAVMAGAPQARRGRKNMSPEERRKVSERMKRYWAKRRSAARKNS